MIVDEDDSANTEWHTADLVSSFSMTLPMSVLSLEAITFCSSAVTASTCNTHAHTHTHMKLLHRTA